MKKIILTTVIALSMLSPAWAADVRFQPHSLLVASKQDDRNGSGAREDRGGNRPPTVIITGKGGKVTGVEREPDKRPRKKK
ncbi:hypothetical protein [uncultured Pseudodesulfovibrio sp.]|uniref:hypothetical protein n=1 Tax=uncultured Pseudodesulfovibrio sp. TaxID=2035858 RepID=UPI0029C7A1BC|nr:hypothetical protein [uncultured Pseudodesulfovibrio sp.]